MSGGRLSRRKHPGCGIFVGDLELGAGSSPPKPLMCRGALDRVTIGDDAGMASSPQKLPILLVPRAVGDDGDDRQPYSAENRTREGDWVKHPQQTALGAAEAIVTIVINAAFARSSNEFGGDNDAKAASSFIATRRHHRTHVATAERLAERAPNHWSRVLPEGVGLNG